MINLFFDLKSKYKRTLVFITNAKAAIIVFAPGPLNALFLVKKSPLVSTA